MTDEISASQTSTTDSTTAEIPPGDNPPTAFDKVEPEPGAKRSLPWLAIVLALLLVAALSALAVTVRQVQKNSAEKSALNDARAAATGYATDMMTYSYADPDKSFGWIDNGGTQAFITKYKGMNNDIKSAVVSAKVSAKGTVVYASANLGDDNKHATVLMFVNQELTGGTNKQTKTAISNFAFQMVKLNGKWLVDDLILH